ncbi:putative lipoprotein [Escherichia coli]|nr:putative lipoprotein [Escherichia coli]
MLQHYSVSWKKGLAALCLLAVAGLSGCDQQENAAAKVEYDGLSNSQPLRVDANNHTVTMLVQINGRFLTDDTRHGIVFKDGSNGHKSLFMGYATPKAFYEALKEAGGTPGENMTMDNKETTHVTGSKLDISVNWQGAAKAYSFDEVIVDSNGKKLDMRFGGNLTAAEEKKRVAWCVWIAARSASSAMQHTLMVRLKNVVKLNSKAMPQFSRRITRWQRLPLKSPNKARIKDDDDAIAKNLVLPYNPHHPVVRYAAGMGAASRRP